MKSKSSAVTIRDVAKKAGDSIATVSRIINNRHEGFSTETKDKVLEVMSQLRHTPDPIARSMVTKRTNLVGVILISQNAS